MPGGKEREGGREGGREGRREEGTRYAQEVGPPGCEQTHCIC